jgi:predicted MFS family arabinose efflux permease
MKYHSTLFGTIFGLVMANRSGIEALPAVMGILGLIGAMILEEYADRKLKKKKEKRAILHGLAFFIMCFTSTFLFMKIFSLDFIKVMTYSIPFAMIMAYAPIRFKGGESG